MIEYVRPNGPETSEFDCANVIKDLEFQEAEFWESGSTDAGLNFFRDGKKTAEIVLAKRQELGVLLLHTYRSDGLQHVVVVPNAGEDEVTIEYAGNDWTLPRRFFVSNQTAIAALKYFAENGERSPQVTWEKF